MTSHLAVTMISISYPINTVKDIMTQNSFIRRFKGYTGKTPKEYQISCRMERATALLLGSDLSLSEIAARCGFASHSFFTKTFKRLYGITPTAYRLGLPKS